MVYAFDMQRERSYQRLIAWQESHNLCLKVYEVTKTFPQEEKFNLINQMRRSASSVPTNIAEGNVKRSNKEQAHFLEISLASLEELHYQLLLSKDLVYLSKDIFESLDNQLQRVGYLISKLRLSLQ